MVRMLVLVLVGTFAVAGLSGCGNEGATNVMNSASEKEKADFIAQYKADMERQQSEATGQK
ncbi:secreted protein [Rhodopirellula sallentina SM41]|uniref:Secreted protein n=2 Tax=Rhodopirellula TaxID=265488 RepID=M5TTQ9_9BACT|nr:secreted protein [Rhodopirellula sallentina SM41]